VAREYRVAPNITYLTASGTELKLDFYTPSGAPGPLPTVLFFHGGGYRVGARKESSVLSLMPYLQLGWNAVNVEYRSSGVALAPAAVEDARCAVRWVSQNAKEYNVDPDRIVLTGQSAGGHLSLVAGMLTEAAGLDRMCPASEPLKIAAIVNWYGPSDYTVLVDDPSRVYAVSWIAAQPNYRDVAVRVSPMTYLRAGVPPTITIHGDADPTVPYQQSVTLHQALTKATVPNELVTIPGGRHGGFPADQYVRAQGAIRAFLARHGIVARSATPPTAQP
jgi:acetyl esterase/lipase